MFRDGQVLLSLLFWPLLEHFSASYSWEFPGKITRIKEFTCQVSTVCSTWARTWTVTLLSLASVCPGSPYVWAVCPLSHGWGAGTLEAGGAFSLYLQLYFLTSNFDITYTALHSTSADCPDCWLSPQRTDVLLHMGWSWTLDQRRAPHSSWKRTSSDNLRIPRHGSPTRLRRDPHDFICSLT